jgi:hypothetical protein
MRMTEDGRELKRNASFCLATSTADNARRVALGGRTSPSGAPTAHALNGLVACDALPGQADRACPAFVRHGRGLSRLSSPGDLAPVSSLRWLVGAFGLVSRERARTWALRRTAFSDRAYTLIKEHPGSRAQRLDVRKKFPLRGRVRRISLASLLSNPSSGNRQGVSLLE